MYALKREGEWYVLCKNGVELLTPQNRSVKTKFKALADRLVLDLEKYGEDPGNPLSLVAFTARNRRAA